jgi:hypothetical protein
MEITIRDGRVEQGNLDTYPIMRLKDAPKIEVHLALTAATKSGGVGEPGTAVVTAAPTNAIFAATGKPGCRSGDWSGVARRVRVLSGTSMADTMAARTPRFPRPLMVVTAVVVILLVGTVALWAYYGTAVFYETILAGIAACI